MCRYAYKISMQTPLGERRGTMLVNIEGQSARGYIDIFGRKGFFEGEIGEDGQYCLHGRIITLIRTINYRATGRADGDRIALTLESERNTLYLTGRACLSGHDE